MVDVLHIELKVVDPTVVGSRHDAGANNIGLTVSDRAGNTGAHTLLIITVDPHLDRTRRLLLKIPLDINAPFRVRNKSMRAVDRVHGHAAPPRHKTDNLIAGERVTAFGEAHHDIIDPMD